MAAAFAEYNAADDDGYDNEAGVTFNPYENPRDCVPGGLYSNAGLGLSSLAEDDEDELDVNPYDNAPTANGRTTQVDSMRRCVFGCLDFLYRMLRRITIILSL